jgi:hypothetical protein
MPIHLDISRIDRLLVIVVRGKVTADDIRDVIPKIAEAGARQFAKIIDVSSATAEIDREQMERIAGALRGGVGADQRGVVAFIVDPQRGEVAGLFSETTRGDRPVKLFRSLHDARRWLAEQRK